MFEEMKDDIKRWNQKLFTINTNHACTWDGDCCFSIGCTIGTCIVHTTPLSFIPQNMDIDALNTDPSGAQSVSLTILEEGFMLSLVLYVVLQEFFCVFWFGISSTLRMKAPLDITHTDGRVRLSMMSWFYSWSWHAHLVHLKCYYFAFISPT